MLSPIVRDYIFAAIKSLQNVTLICSKTNAKHSSLEKSDNYKQQFSNTVFQDLFHLPTVMHNSFIH